MNHSHWPSRAEETANTISHGLGLLAAIAAAPVLILTVVGLGRTESTVGASIFAFTMVLMYFTSTFYHALPEGGRKKLFQKLDHAAIYLLIAGTYTPFTLGVLKGAWGWTLLGLIWALASVGVVLKAYDRLANPRLSTGLYLVMGWLILIAAVPLAARVPVNGLLWLAGGGLAYTAGVAFFALESRLRFSHLIWHLFVMAGTGCHFCAVLWYAAG